jgi:hypothetical protein
MKWRAFKYIPAIGDQRYKRVFTLKWRRIGDYYYWLTLVTRVQEYLIIGDKNKWVTIDYI